MLKTARLSLLVLLGSSLVSTRLTQIAPVAGEPATVAIGQDRPSEGPLIAAMAGRPCSSGVVFTRNLKYENDEGSILDVANSADDDVGPKRRPIVMFFTTGSQDPVRSTEELVITAAMCFAAEHDLLAVHARYPDADGRHPEKLTKGAAAAISWVFENADLFHGNVREIIPIGFGASAAPLVDLLLNKVRLDHADIAGTILISIEFDATQRIADSAVGLSAVAIPVLLAWSTNDSAEIRAANDRFRTLLCDAGHCPRTAMLGPSGNLASVFNLDGSNPELHEKLRQLIGQIDARGLP